MPGIAAGLLGTALAADDPGDRAAFLPILNQVLEFEPSGKEIPWSSAATGRAGIIRVDRTFYRSQQPCRDYTRTTSGAGRAEEVRGTGCRVGKLRWDLTEAPPVDVAAKPAATADPPTKASAPPDPGVAGARDVSARPGTPAGSADSPSSRPPPRPPALRYKLPTRSQL